MRVVADSSPLVVLVQIEHIDVLPKLFGQVLVPPEVWAELCGSKRPQSIREFFRQRPTWLAERAPTALEPIPGLHAGEVAAISLARELKADLLLIDDRDGRKAAAERGIPLTGTIGVLEVAAEQGLLGLEDAFARVKRTDFWIAPQLLDERLKLHRERRRDP